MKDLPCQNLHIECRWWNWPARSHAWWLGFQMDLVESTQSWDVKQTFVSCYVHSGLQILSAAFQLVLALVVGFSMFSEHLFLEVDCLIYISTANTRGNTITVLVRKVVSILPAPCCSHLDTETLFSVCSPDSESRRADKIFFPPWTASQVESGCILNFGGTRVSSGYILSRFPNLPQVWLVFCIVPWLFC